MDIIVSKRIALARFIMIFGIIVLHIPPFQPLYEVHQNPFELIKAFFSHGVFRASVPLLTAISGFLLFSSGIDKTPSTLFKKKSKSILIPLLLWNMPLALAIYLLQKYGLTNHKFSVNLYPLEWRSIVNALTGLFSSPVNYPTNFLRDLLAVSLLAPALGFFLRRMPYVGLVLIAIIYWFNLDGIFVLRNMMLISFYIGGLAAIQNWDLKALDRFSPILLGIFIIFSATIVAFDIHNREFFSLISPFLVWPCLSLLTGTRLGALFRHYSKHSFFIFSAHAPVLVILWLMYCLISSSMPYPIFWITAPLLTTSLCILGSKYSVRIAPKSAHLLLGSRSKDEKNCLK